jgi:UDP-2,3-diacylglucosamine hydrolase
MTASLSSINRLWVFSDLHLSDPEEPLYQSFLRALDEPNSALDTVVFAGDIFEVFVGNSAYFKNKFEAFFKVLKDLQHKKVKLYYIQGNHDFHLQEAISPYSVIILDSELVLGKIYIAHGDLVDQSDYAYLKMRKLFRSNLVQQSVRFLPGKMIQLIADSIARTHDQKEKDLSNEPGVIPLVRPIYRAFAEEKKRQGFDFVILGHCHDLDDLQPFYFNMGYPPVHRQFLFYSAESNSFKRRVFTGI